MPKGALTGCSVLIKHHSIIFSFWKRSLDVVGKMLTEHGISHCQVDGRLSKRQKTIALEDFRNNPKSTLLLITLGTGSTG